MNAFLFLKYMDTLQIFIYIYECVNKENLTLQESQIKSANKFIYLVEEEYKESIGENFWFDFICYQFEFYIRSDQARRKISPNWVFGEKALNRWRNKDKEFWRHWVSIFKGRFNVRSNILEQKGIPDELLELEKERERKRFYNTDQGFIYCLENKYFNNKCSTCLLCKNFRFCNV